ncbi:hypothetical protein BDK51DRAFT_34072 [Blyttiomyces helicus]|uniref:Uncharacterized protein n=1 Tax=Blyttiomyces helicus TaxID=388810 RepID=A0A4V1IRC1_9FUNG|nr:hypothetical protein BDK51DRAFT_34072 [Blyttiomyces helicus]|eukprot:RKO89537.1 hypothetical protein BDK51DRAFT_34072 [Blyttiomyces helicus]
MNLLREDSLSLTATSHLKGARDDTVWIPPNHPHLPTLATLIGRFDEGLLLWFELPDAPLIPTLEPMFKGVHRVLVSMFEATEAGASADASQQGIPSLYRVETQTDVVRLFLEACNPAVLSGAISGAGLGTAPVAASSAIGNARDFLADMAAHTISAVPVVEGAASYPYP